MTDPMTFIPEMPGGTSVRKDGCHQ